MSKIQILTKLKTQIVKKNNKPKLWQKSKTQTMKKLKLWRTQ